MKFLILMLAISSSTAIADYKKQWCVGEDGNKCPVKPAYACPQDGGPGDQAVARSVCTITTPDGQKVLNFRVETMSSEGGNKCGYTVYQATCYEPTSK